MIKFEERLNLRIIDLEEIADQDMLRIKNEPLQEELDVAKLD